MARRQCQRGNSKAKRRNRYNPSAPDWAAVHVGRPAVRLLDALFFRPHRAAAGARP